MKKIAFLGLGLMGEPMAKNLLKAGYTVTVYNRSHNKTIPLQKLGAKVANTPQETADNADIIISIVSDSKAVREVLLGQDGVIQSVKKGALVIDMSTVDPQTERNCYQEFKKKRVGFLDAPVTGSTPGAVSGTLTIMVGGSKKDFDRAQAVFNVLGSKIFYMGKAGQGMATKLVLNALIAITVYGYAEVLMLAEAQNIKRDAIIGFLNSTGSTSDMMRFKSENFLNNKLKPAFYTKHMTKDIRLALHEAENYNVFMPSLAAVSQVFSVALKAGMGEEDMSSIIKVLEKINK